MIYIPDNFYTGGDRVEINVKNSNKISTNKNIDLIIKKLFLVPTLKSTKNNFTVFEDSSLFLKNISVAEYSPERSPLSGMAESSSSGTSKLILFYFILFHFILFYFILFLFISPASILHFFLQLRFSIVVFVYYKFYHNFPFVFYLLYFLIFYYFIPGVLLLASVSVNPLAALAIQRITTNMVHNNQIQTIQVNNTNKINKNSTFVLYIDLSTYGYGIQSTEPISVFAVAMRENEITNRKKTNFGENLGESLQSKIENITGFQNLNITGNLFNFVFSMSFLFCFPVVFCFDFLFISTTNFNFNFYCLHF